MDVREKDNCENCESTNQLSKRKQQTARKGYQFFLGKEKQEQSMVYKFVT